MKTFFTKRFSPILKLFEKGEEPENYQPSHRKILLIMGVLFLGLAGVSLYFTFRTDQMAALLPTLIFAGIGLICAIVGFLGSDKAVSNIWRSAR
ncbi:MAG: hypothetical protein IE909_15150 [Campylobacterales bacterium]|nr:hypothetical protein [Campylobacterales bacterium]